MGVAQASISLCARDDDQDHSTGHLQAKQQPLRNHEHILVFCRGQPPYVFGGQNGPLKSNAQNIRPVNRSTGSAPIKVFGGSLLPTNRRSQTAQTAAWAAWPGGKLNVFCKSSAKVTDGPDCDSHDGSSAKKVTVQQFTNYPRTVVAFTPCPAKRLHSAQKPIDAVAHGRPVGRRGRLSRTCSNTSFSHTPTPMT